MEHHHHHSTNNIKIAFFLNLSFTILEIIGGIWTNSVAILSDALHDLGDSFSLALAWFLENFSKKKGTQRYSYGYGRFSLLGALLNAIILISGSVFILSETIPRLLNPEDSYAPGMILFAILGIAMNGYAALKLQQDHTMNAKMVAWHLLEDVLGWVLVLIVGITLLFVSIPLLDPILAILLTLYILFNVVKNLNKTVRLFLQATPDDVDLHVLESKVKSIEGIKDMHHTHLWSLDGEHQVLTTHIVLYDSVEGQKVFGIKKQILDNLSDLHLSHITIEVEYEYEPCLMQIK